MIFERKSFKYWKILKEIPDLYCMSILHRELLHLSNQSLSSVRKDTFCIYNIHLLAYQVWFRLYSSIKQSVFKNRNQASNFPSELKESFSRSKLLLLELRRWRASMKLNMLSKIWRIMINIQISQYSTYWAVPSLFSAMQE